MSNPGHGSGDKLAKRDTREFERGDALGVLQENLQYFKNLLKQMELEYGPLTKSQYSYDFEEIVLGKDVTLTSLKAITGSDTVPQIYIDNNHIGDSEALTKFLQN